MTSRSSVKTKAFVPNVPAALLTAGASRARGIASTFGWLWRGRWHHWLGRSSQRDHVFRAFILHLVGRRPYVSSSLASWLVSACVRANINALLMGSISKSRVRALVLSDLWTDSSAVQSRPEGERVSFNVDMLRVPHEAICERPDTLGHGCGK